MWDVGALATSGWYALLAYICARLGGAASAPIAHRVNDIDRHGALERFGSEGVSFYIDMIRKCNAR